MADEVVGREVELAAIDRFVERAATGLAALVLEGEAGIGKTTIWEAAVDAARSSGFRVLRSRPARSEQGLTLGGLTDLLGESTTRTSRACPIPNAGRSRSRCFGRARRAPRPTSEPCRWRSPACSAARRRRPGPRRHRRRAVARRSSAAIVAYAMRRLADRPIGLLVSVRTGRDGGIGTRPRGGREPDRTERIVLGPLPLASLHRLFQDRLAGRFPARALRIEAASGGNPLYALEIGRALARSGPRDGPATRRCRYRARSALLIEGRISALPPATRRACCSRPPAAEPTVETLERASPRLRDGARAGHRRRPRRDRPRRRPVRPSAVRPGRAAARATPDELRAAHAVLADATASADARARHLGRRGRRPRRGCRRGARGRGGRAPRPRRDARRRCALPRGERGRRRTRARRAPARRARLAAECLFIDLSEIRRGRPDPRGGDRGGSAGSGAGRGAEPAGDHPLLPRPTSPRRSRSASRRWRRPARTRSCAPGSSAGSAILVMQLDLERGVASHRRGGDRCSTARRAGSRRPRPLANALLLRAAGELGLVRPTRPARSNAVSASSRPTAARGRRRAPTAAPSGSPGSPTISTGRSR